MNDNVQNVIVKVDPKHLINLITRLEIVSDYCDSEFHLPMVGTIYETIELFQNIIDSINLK